MESRDVLPLRRVRLHSFLVVATLVLSALVATAWMLLTFGNPFPPDHVVMATGPVGSGQAALGGRYQELLRRAGVDLRLVPTRGGVENLARLEDPLSGVSAAFIESGVTKGTESRELASLGTVYIEALWAFSRDLSGATPRERFGGKRISIEPEGSATRVMARRVLALNGLAEGDVTLLALAPEEVAAALLEGEIDVAFLLTTWRSPAVRKLLLAEGVRLEGYPRADAYVALFPSLSKVVLPAGVVDLERNIPAADLPLLAIEVSLVVHRKLHPAIQYLLLDAAAEIHGGPELFHRAGRYPAADASDPPLSVQARTYYKSGRPFVYHYVPVWMAGLAERLILLFIPLFAVVFPVAHFLPTLLGYITERRIFSLYRDLEVVERALELPGSLGAAGELAATLVELERRANHLRVPLSFAQRLFILKSHIALAQERVEKRAGPASSSALG